MPHTTVSACHSLELIQCNQILRFSHVGSCVKMTTVYPLYRAEAVPGTISVSQTSDQNAIKKRITYECAALTAKVADALATLSGARLVATYVDERGNRRVCGSPEYPLSLSYTEADGVFTVTIEGQDTDIDAFLMD